MGLTRQGQQSRQGASSTHEDERLYSIYSLGGGGSIGGRLTSVPRIPERLRRLSGGGGRGDGGMWGEYERTI